MMPDEHSTLGADAPAAASDGRPVPRRAPDLAEEKLRLRLALRDPEQFGWFVDRYGRRIFAFAFLLTRDREMARDVTQETFLRAYEHLGRFRWQNVSFGAWLHRIALNETRMWARANGLRRRLETAVAEVPDRADWRPGPDDLAVVADESARLNEALAALDDDDAYLVRQHHLEGVTLVELAALYDVSPGAMKARMDRARKRLGRILVEQERAAAAAALREEQEANKRTRMTPIVARKGS